MSEDDNRRPSLDELRHQIAPIELTRDTIGGEREVPYELRTHRDFVLPKANEDSAPKSQTAQPVQPRQEPDQLSFGFMEDGNV